MKSVLEKIVFCIILISLCSCWLPPSKITDEISGTYEFEFPRGDYQLLKIYKDSSYIQELYMDKKSFNKKVPPFYVNKGNWSVVQEYELRFNGWLEYCYLRNPDSILPHPKKVGMGDVIWIKPGVNHNGYISIFDETGYYFSKIEEKKDTDK